MNTIAWLLESFAGTTWVDWVDIALLSFVFYRVLLALQGTRAVQSLVGLGLVAVLYLVSDLLGLTSVHWVLDNLFVYVVIAVLILFQDDIRRALARAGGTLFVGPIGVRRADANVLEEVIKACFSLAHRKIGALIVLERGASLEPYTEGAHPLDAVVSTELLQSVFHPSSPLHDGAVVISHGRVVAASVFLPISLSKEIKRSWGTRHRAAIGLSEETDGLCLVVSEERGTVALVKHGEVTPVADANDLRQRIVEKFEDKSDKAVAETVSVGGGAGG